MFRMREILKVVVKTSLRIMVSARGISEIETGYYREGKRVRSERERKREREREGEK